MTQDLPSASPPSSPPSPAGDDPHARNPLGRFVERGIDPRQESNRVTAALVVFLTLSAVVLNVGIYQGSRTRLLKERREQLVSFTEGKRREIRSVLKELEREARFAAGQDEIRQHVTAAGAGDRAALERHLDRSATAFRFRAIRILAADGSIVGSTVGAEGPASELELAISRRVLRLGQPVVRPGRLLGGPQPALLFAVPIAPAGRNVARATAVFYASVSEVLRPVLSGPTGFGMASVYLVAMIGKEPVALTVPPDDLGIAAGDAIPASGPAARALAAARGAETSVEAPDGPRWGVTRLLPETTIGVIGEVDRAVALAGTRETLAGLLVLDVGIALLAATVIWLWRRRYGAELARRELELSRRQLDRIQAVFDNAFDLILTFDVQGRIHTANRSAQSLFKRTASQMENEPIHRFLRCAKPGAIESLPLQMVTRTEAMGADGTVMPVEFSLACSGEGDDRVYTAIVRDISERVDAEARIRSFADGLEVTNRRLEEANAQLEEASRLKSEFLANTSHELRTPLNGMIGFLQLVLDDMCDSPEEERDFLQQALQCSRHLLGLINDVLDIAKIEAGKLSLEIGPVDVQALFGEIYTLTHVQAAQKGIHLKFAPPEKTTGPVRGDFNKIKQVLLSLLGNSLKFTSKGSITVRATEHPDLGYYMFEVEDTGIGIPSDRQKMIFEKFTQGDGSTTRKYGGTGLGLAISRSLVELMGGIIGVHSDGPGKGTRIYFSLPLWRVVEDEPEDEDLRAPEQIEGPAGGPLVLVVEDDPVFRKFIVALLHKHGYRTVMAPSAERGWVLARRLSPAVVVLDYALSCAEAANLRTGWDLAERLTTDARTRSIPLIFVTGFDFQLKDKLKDTALAHPPEHLMKPVEGPVLLAKIDQVVGSSHDGIVRVLMADDDPSVAAYVRKVLPQHRFHLEIANNGEECLHILRTQPRGFDLLLLDLMMPDVSGYDVLREMSLNSHLSEIPVLILTNFPEARTDEEKRLLERGLVLDVISKPAVHENPALLPHILDWHLQVVDELGPGGGARPDAPAAVEAEREAA